MHIYTYILYRKANIIYEIVVHWCEKKLYISMHLVFTQYMHRNISINTFVPISTIDTGVWRAYVNCDIMVSLWLCVETRRIGTYLYEYFISVTYI